VRRFVNEIDNIVKKRKAFILKRQRIKRGAWTARTGISAFDVRGMEEEIKKRFIGNVVSGFAIKNMHICIYTNLCFGR